MIYITAGTRDFAEWLAWRCGLLRNEWCYVTRSDYLRGIRGGVLIQYHRHQDQNEWREIEKVAMAQRFKIVKIHRIQ